MGNLTLERTPSRAYLTEQISSLLMSVLCNVPSVIHAASSLRSLTSLVRGWITLHPFLLCWACVESGSPWYLLCIWRLLFQILFCRLTRFQCTAFAEKPWHFSCLYSANAVGYRASCFIKSCWLLSFALANPPFSISFRSLLRISRRWTVTLRSHLRIWNSCDEQFASNKMAFYKQEKENKHIFLKVQRKASISVLSAPEHFLRPSSLSFSGMVMTSPYGWIGLETVSNLHSRCAGHGCFISLLLRSSTSSNKVRWTLLNDRNE